MARVTSFQYDDSLRFRSGRTTTGCTWAAGDLDGEALLVLRTHGSAERQDKGSVSQALEIDEAIAQDLIVALRTVFPRVS
jgi:hypothetical protein